MGIAIAGLVITGLCAARQSWIQLSPMRMAQGRTGPKRTQKGEAEKTEQLSTERCRQSSSNAIFRQLPPNEPDELRSRKPAGFDQKFAGGMIVTGLEKDAP
jgi:hypothetical protein